MVSQPPDGELNVGRAHYGVEFRRRAPWILLAVAAGMAMVWIGRSFEEQLSGRIELVFFVPMIVYMSDAIGTETLALVVRSLATDHMHVQRIFLKELAVGLSLGATGGVPMGLIAYAWFGEWQLAVTVASAMVANGAVAVLLGMLIPGIFARLGRDPAVGTEEIGTALSDIVSILIYLAVATLILFGG
ncbi:MAG TPA: magnesium transporter [Sphingomicrobium sp.]|nr:magnesium transporter [Sphingomicrobium sp.]